MPAAAYWREFQGVPADDSGNPFGIAASGAGTSIDLSSITTYDPLRVTFTATGGGQVLRP